MWYEKKFRERKVFKEKNLLFNVWLEKIRIMIKRSLFYMKVYYIIVFYFEFIFFVYVNYIYIDI